jgi:hypothetical protein
VNYSLARLVGFGFGIPLLAIAIFAMVHGVKAQSWPMTEGTVSVSRRVSKSLNFRVDYQANGRQLSCSRIEYGRNPQARDRYRYYEGAKVRVFYSPLDPEECVLEPGLSPAMAVEFLLGVCLSILGIYANGRLQLSRSITLPQEDRTEPTETDLEQVKELAASGRMIEAIKMYRTLTGKGLSESKKALEEYLRSGDFKPKS